jgi:hypothetical protein
MPGQNGTALASPLGMRPRPNLTLCLHPELEPKFDGYHYGCRVCGVTLRPAIGITVKEVLSYEGQGEGAIWALRREFSCRGLRHYRARKRAGVLDAVDLLVLPDERGREFGRLGWRCKEKRLRRGGCPI